jgi:sporulation protein YlmC with PRC-barrel domain
MRLELGTPVRCTDGHFGELRDAVIDPRAKRVTHLVIGPHHNPSATRLVPIELADGGAEQEIALHCSLMEANAFDSAQDFAYLRLDELPVEDPNWDIGIENVLAMPYYQAGDPVGSAYAYSDKVAVSYDRVPKGDVEIRHSSPVTSSDGHVVGHVGGFVVDDDDEQITHLMLEQRHLWRRRRVSIPMSSVTKVETDSVEVHMTKRQLKALPSMRRQ